MSKFTESHPRTIAKAIIYRILVTISIALLVLAFGATTAQASLVVMISIVLGLTVYYVHERLWLMTGWKRSDYAEDGTSRSIVKTITYRGIIMIVAFATFKLVLGQDNTNTLEMTIAQSVVNMGWFYLIERLFNRISWGKIPVADSTEQPAVTA